MVEGPGQRRATVEARAPEGGLEPHHPAQRRRDADRTPRVRAQGRVHHAARHRRRRPAARPARVAGGVAGVRGGAVVGVGRPRPVREFRKPGLAHDDRPRRAQVLHRGRVVAGDVFRKDSRSGGGDRVPHGQEILDRDGNPVQRSAPSAARHLILRATRRRPRLLRKHQLKGVGPAVVLLDPGERMLGQFYGRDRTGAHQWRQLGDGRGPALAIVPPRRRGTQMRLRGLSRPGGPWFIARGVRFSAKGCRGRPRGQALGRLVIPRSIGSGKRPSRQVVRNAVVARREEGAKDRRPLRNALRHHPLDVLFPGRNARRAQVRPQTLYGEVPIARRHCGRRSPGWRAAPPDDACTTGTSADRS